MTDVWFRYRDDDRKSYYYNNSTHETTWSFPVGRGSVWDAVSKRKLKLPTRTKLRPPPPPKPPASESSDDDEYSSNQSEKEQSEQSEGSEHSEGPVGPVVADYAQELVDKWGRVSFEFSKFESEHMNKLKKDKFSNSDKPIEAPLLNSVKKGDSKTALKNYKIILKQAGVTVAKGLKGNETMLDLIQTFGESHDLVDEAYAGLWKQTTNCKKDHLTLLLDMFLVLSTSFVPSRFMFTPLLKHLATLSGSDKYARFVLIRLYDTISRGQPLQKCSSDDDIKVILNHYKKGNCNFGVSQYELFFNQYQSRPTAPIPYIEYSLLEYVRNQGGRDKQNIFRSAGSKKTIDSLVQKGNSEKDLLEGQSLDDVASLFKRWLELMPGRLIQIKYQKEFQAATSDIGDQDPAIEFVNTLPDSVQAILKYLVGFLRDFAENSSVTQMSLDDFATVFGRIVVYEDQDADPMKFTQQVKYFMKSILDKWDIGDSYPIPEAMMKEKK